MDLMVHGWQTGRHVGATPSACSAQRVTKSSLDVKSCVAPLATGYELLPCFSLVLCAPVSLLGRVLDLWR